MEEFDSQGVSPNCHEYNIDVMVWLHAVKIGSRCVHQRDSNERKLSPPGNAARPSESHLGVCANASLPRSGGDCVTAGRGCAVGPLAGDTMVRSSSRGNWHMICESSRAVPQLYRISRCRRVLVNVPKYSLKPGINEGILNLVRLRVCNLVID